MESPKQSNEEGISESVSVDTAAGGASSLRRRRQQQQQQQARNNAIVVSEPVSEQATYHAEDKDAVEEGSDATASGFLMGVIRAASRTAVQVFTGRESWRQNQYSSHSAQSLDTSEAERQREAVEIAKLKSETARLKLEAANIELEDAKRESEFALLMQEYKAKVLENELELKRLEAQLQAGGGPAVAAADPDPDPPGDAPTTAPSSPSPAR